jgi:ankyrin repeat protein
MVELLIAHGANCRAKNRRGAEPLHYAADGRTESDDQILVIEYLIANRADPNAVDMSGVTPLHRAVRRRSLDAVRSLLDGGANVRKRNRSGSTPLHLAVQNTGASGSGSHEAGEQQAAIIKLLLERGARPSDMDSKGKSVEQAARNGRIRDLLYD